MPRPLSSSSKKSRLVKPQGRLLDLAEINKSPSLLLRDIQKYLIDRIDQPSDRRQDILHPSEMAHSDWCPRQSNYRLACAKETNPQKAHSHVLENIFDEGHTIHHKWQQRLWDMGRLWGDWFCLSCGVRWADNAPVACPECGVGKSLLRYDEVPLNGEDKWLIAGHEDGAINDLNALVEIKSIGQGTLRLEDPGLLRDHHKETVEGKKVYDLDGIWRDLKRPLPGHIRQTAIYLALCKEMGLPYDRVIFLYEYKSNQLVKEFNIKYNPRIAEPLLDKALDIKYALSKGTVVSRPPELTEESKTCKGCPYQSLCWSKNEPPSDPSTEAEDGEQLGSGRPLGRSSGASVGAGHRPTGTSRRDHPRTSGRSNGPGRQPTDDPVHEPDGVAGVHGGATGVGRGRREVRRRSTRPD